MNVLTLTSQDQVDKYSKQPWVLDGKYDKIVINGITNLSGSFISSCVSSHYVHIPEVEIQNCTITEYIDVYKPEKSFKITIKDSIIQQYFYIGYPHTFFSVVIDNITCVNNGFIDFANSKKTYTGNKSMISIKNSSKVKIELDIDTDICNIDFSNNHDMDGFKIFVRTIPNKGTEQSKFISQFKDIKATVELSKIDESNYQFDQADWDKLISLLDTYPKLFNYFEIDNFDALMRNNSIVNNDLYIHIPSLTFPLCWLNNIHWIYDSIIKNATSAKTFAWFYLNKNNGHNFTITHFSTDNSR